MLAKQGQERAINLFYEVKSLIGQPISLPWIPPHRHWKLGIEVPSRDIGEDSPPYPSFQSLLLLVLNLGLLSYARYLVS